MCQILNMFSSNWKAFFSVPAKRKGFRLPQNQEAKEWAKKSQENYFSCQIVENPRDLYT